MIDELRVEYPSDPTLRSVGRVAVIGVLLRLRMPMMAVEQFRSELDTALAEVGGSGSRGAIKLHAKWNGDEIVVNIDGPRGSKVLRRPRIHR